MKWLMVLAVTILHNENSFPPKTYELRAYTSFGHCSQAKADIDYIFKDKHIKHLSQIGIEDEFAKKKILKILGDSLTTEIFMKRFL